MSRVMLVVILATCALVLVTALVIGAQVAGASPSPSPSPTASPDPVYPTAQQVAAVKALHRRTCRARHTLARVRACFKDHRPNPVACLPPRGSLLAEWQRTERRLWHQLRDWRGKVRDGRRRMLSPGGSGAARWAPLMRWTGWSEYGIAVMVPIVQRESSGSPHEPNHEGSGCYGLFQLHPCWWPEGIAWIRSPEHQCRRAWHIFHVLQHDSPYPAWAL